MTHRRLTSVLVLGLAAVLLLSASPVLAFNQVQARALSMGGAHAVTAQGIETIGWNPAFMAFKNTYSGSFLIPGLNAGMRLSNDFLSLDQIDKYFQEGQYWDDETKQLILDEFEGDEWDFYTDLYVPVFAISFRTKFATLAFNADVGVSSDLQFSKEFIRLALTGNPIAEFGTERDFGDTGIRGQGNARIAMSAGKNLANLFKYNDFVDDAAVGFTFSYYMGLGYANTDKVEGTFYTASDSLLGYGYIETVNAGFTGDADSTEYDPLAGSGVGLDIGFGVKMMDEKLTLGVSAINIVNTITYSGAQKRIYGMNFAEPLPTSGLEDPEAWIEKNLTSIDSLAEDSMDIQTSVPSVLHLNVGYQLTRAIMLAGNVRMGLNDAPGGKKAMRAGAGIEFRPIGLLPLRAGFSAGGRGGFSYGAGFGLHFGFWHTDVGFAWERGFANSANGFHFALNTVWFFGNPNKVEPATVPEEDLLDY